MSYESKKANKELKQLTDAFKTNYRLAASQSRDNYVLSLPAGSRVPSEMKFYDKASREQFEVKCQELRQKARSIIDAHIEEVKKQSAAAPSEEALRAVQMLSLRSRPTEEEIDNILTVYGRDNPTVWRTVVGIANDHEIRGWAAHPVDHQLEGIEKLAHDMEWNISAAAAERGRAGDGYMSLLDAQIDQVFDPEL